jgi:hypothetical protein
MQASLHRVLDNMAKSISIYELEAGEKQFFSPFCWAARLAIAHKEIPIDTIRWRFKEQEKIAFSGQSLVSCSSFAQGVLMLPSFTQWGVKYFQRLPHITYVQHTAAHQQHSCTITQRT